MHYSQVDLILAKFIKEIIYTNYGWKHLYFDYTYKEIYFFSS